jgi:23S rRNA pseudouridine2605 synthase
MGNFDKFSKKEVTGAKKKEAFRQEKKVTKKETAEYFKEKKAKQKSGLIDRKNVESVKKTLPLKSAAKPAEAPKAEAGKVSKTLPVKSPSKGTLPVSASDDENMPLNKYVAHGGLCSRREAAIWVKEGKIKVNGKVVLEPSYKVQPDDKVTSNGKLVVPKQHLVYILLNKPKDFLTTASDDQGRKTVMDIVKNATTERVYPVGRLDRNTTGVLLLTNDGDLAQQLTHPKFEIKKIYEVRLDKPVTKADLDQLVQGITLEDGPISADAAAFADPKDRSIVGVEIHSGRNRIVRRMFEHLGYDVKNLDRVMFASLTKKNVERGKWRFLTEKEVRLLKYFQKSKK